MLAVRPRNLASYVLPVTVIAVVVAAVVTALLLAGSPAEERRRWGDSVRAHDLQAIARAVERWHDERRLLPESLADLKERDSALRTEDPETGEAYSYRRLDAREYELCATFRTDTSKATDPSEVRSAQGWWYVDESKPFWKHAAGRHCFRLTVRPAPAPRVAQPTERVGR
jgi:hypothetical protein